MERYTKAGLIALGLILALGACTRNAGTASTTASPAESSAASPMASATAMQNGVAASEGGKLYRTNCSSCHQANGQGVPDTFPPLAANPVVAGDPTTVIRIVRYGLNGKIAVKGHSYNGMMPAWGQQLSNADIAALVTYIRSSWGNNASAVTEAQVAAVHQ